MRSLTGSRTYTVPASNRAARRLYPGIIRWGPGRPPAYNTHRQRRVYRYPVYAHILLRGFGRWYRTPDSHGEV